MSTYPLTPRRRMLRAAILQWAEGIGHPFPEAVAEEMLKVDAEMRAFVAAGRGTLAEAATAAARKRGMEAAAPF